MNMRAVAPVSLLAEAIQTNACSGRGRQQAYRKTISDNNSYVDERENELSTSYFLCSRIAHSYIESKS